MRTVVAVEPYLYKTSSNFKHKPWAGWRKNCGKVASSSYPRFLHKILFSMDLIPNINILSNNVRLCFVTPASLYFDTWSSVAFHEIIPFFWDCWEDTDDKVCKWINKHKIKTCIFTSSISRDRIVKRLPYLQTFVVTEGIDVENYPEGRNLIDRNIDYYSFGRIPKEIRNLSFDGINAVFNGSDEDFKSNIKNAKITIAVPRCDVVPFCHETLTQRYWECMLSRMIMVGRAPKELIDLIGYNPVIDIDYDNYENQLRVILSHISDYQSLVDKNRETALRMAPWEIRMKQVMEWLKSIGYEI